MKQITIILLCVFFFPFHNLSGQEIRQWETKELSDLDKEKIVSLANLYGYIRYFYPNEDSETFDWYRFLSYSLTQLENCKSRSEISATLDQLFSPICPHLSINQIKESASFSSHGKGFYICKNQNEPNGVIHSVEYVEQHVPEYPRPDSLYSFSLSESFTAFLPLAVSVMPKKGKAYKDLHRAMKEVDLRLFEKSSFSVLVGRGTGGVSFVKKVENRIANEMMRYAIVKFFYPYFQEDSLSPIWDHSFESHCGKVASCNNLLDYYEAVCMFLHLLKDAHVGINYSLTLGKMATYAPEYYPSINIQFEEDRAVIACSEDSSLVGSTILEVNDQPIQSVIDRKLKSLSYSRKDVAFHKLSSHLFRSFKKDSIVELTLLKNGNRMTDTIKIGLSSPYATEEKDFMCFADSLVYINLTSGKGSYEHFATEIEKIRQMKGIIFDMRGYIQPYALSIIAHLIHSKVELGNLSQPVSIFPYQPFYKAVEKWGIYPATADDSKSRAIQNEYQEPLPIHLDLPCVFLMDASSISFTETMLDIIKAYKIGLLVGENSAGCNGDIMFIKLPFASFSMTGFKYANRDSTQHHVYGISPDIRVERGNEVDKQLETAKAYCK